MAGQLASWVTVTVKLTSSSTLGRVGAVGESVPPTDTEVEVALVAAYADVLNDDLDGVAAASDRIVGGKARVGNANTAAAQSVATEGRADADDHGATGALHTARAIGAIFYEVPKKEVSGWSGSKGWVV